jgi:hypothetical protein
MSDIILFYEDTIWFEEVKWLEALGEYTKEIFEFLKSEWLGELIELGEFRLRTAENCLELFW